MSVRGAIAAQAPPRSRFVTFTPGFGDRRPPRGRHAAPPILAAVVVLLVAGCGNPYPYRPFSPRVTPALGVLNDAHARVRYFYATDRRRTDDHEFDRWFGIERAPRASCGQIEASIPVAHGRGRLELRPVLGPRDPNRYVMLTDLSPPAETQAEFWQALAASVALSREREVFVFIHGFYVGFAEAALRTAQIAHDIEFDGAAVVYSWPSQGWLLGYLADMSNVEWAEPHLVQFLQELHERAGAKRVHVLAHSMGARLLCRALREFTREHPEIETPLDQVVLAAADIDAEIFERDYAPVLSRAARRVTLYVSDADRALGGSARVNGYVRLGQAAPTTQAARRFPTIDVVDVTEVDRVSVGHYYYGSNPDVLDDLRLVIRGALIEERALDRRSGYFALLPESTKAASLGK